MLIGAVLAAAACSGDSSAMSSGPSTSTAPAGGDGTVVTALDLLGTLTVHLEIDDGSYDRGLYPHWSRTASGCSTRVEVLIRDSRTPAQVDRTGRCAVLPGGGDWYSPFDDVWTDQPGDIDIDHVVALSEAHRSGAWAWDDARREAFANDLDRPYTLLAVTSTVNQSKGDRDPADWLPSNEAYVCEYLATWVQIKADWQLSVDPAEHRAIADGLGECGDIAAPGEGAVGSDEAAP